MTHKHKMCVKQANLCFSVRGSAPEASHVLDPTFPTVQLDSFIYTDTDDIMFVCCFFLFSQALEGSRTRIIQLFHRDALIGMGINKRDLICCPSPGQFPPTWPGWRSRPAVDTH